MSAQLSFTIKAGDVSSDEVVKRLKALDGVVTIAHTGGGDRGFVVFDGPESAAKARAAVADDVQVELQDADAKAPSPAKKQPAPTAGVKKGRGNNKAAEFFTGPNPNEQRQQRAPQAQGQRPPRQQQGEQRQGSGRGGYNTGRGRGGEGRGRGGEGRGRGRGRGDGAQHVQRPRTIESHIACVNGVPPHMTNGELFDIFRSAGHIFNIARHERMALLYLAAPENVTNAIALMNGHKVDGSVFIVCGGGTMELVPPPPPPHGPAPPVMGRGSPSM